MFLPPRVFSTWHNSWKPAAKVELGHVRFVQDVAAVTHMSSQIGKKVEVGEQFILMLSQSFLCG